MTPPVPMSVLSPLCTRSGSDDTLGFVHLDGDALPRVERVDADPDGMSAGDERPASERSVVTQKGVGGDPDLAISALAGGERDPGDPGQAGAVVASVELHVRLGDVHCRPLVEVRRAEAEPDGTVHDVGV